MKRIGIIGLGSMGKRRARDLLALGCEVMSVRQPVRSNCGITQDVQCHRGF